jgi:predicted nucleotidyltransferase
MRWRACWPRRTKPSRAATRPEDVATPILFAHPIEPQVREDVLARLRDIEREHDVTVLFACESGSRGWGFASPDSDYDVRFVYVNRLPWYLSVEPRRDVIEQPIDALLDINGWDLRKALQLLKQSNPTLVEWLHSPIVYLEQAGPMARFRALVQTAFSDVRAYHHYVSMAKKTDREHLRGETVRFKKYLYVLRPLLAARWIREGRGVPPMRFAELAEAVLADEALIAEINRLLEVKMRAGEAATSAPWPALRAFIDAELELAQAYLPQPNERGDFAALDAYLYDTVRQFDRA